MERCQRNPNARADSCNGAVTAHTPLLFPATAPAIADTSASHGNGLYFSVTPFTVHAPAFGFASKCDTIVRCCIVTPTPLRCRVTASRLRARHWTRKQQCPRQCHARKDAGAVAENGVRYRQTRCRSQLVLGRAAWQGTAQLARQPQRARRARGLSRRQSSRHG